MRILLIIIHKQLFGQVGKERVTSITVLFRKPLEQHNNQYTRKSKLFAFYYDFVSKHYINNNKCFKAPRIICLILYRGGLVSELVFTLVSLMCVLKLTFVRLLFWRNSSFS